MRLSNVKHNGTECIPIPSSVSNVLDIIKIIASLVVLLGHSFGLLSISVFRKSQYFPHIQSLAVVVFLIVSGFLTDASLHNKMGRVSFSVYVRHRMLRVFRYLIPALLLIALFDVVWIKLRPETYAYYASYNLETLIRNLFMLPGLTPKYFPDGTLFLAPIYTLFQTCQFGSGRPLWTLFIEWWLWIFYGYFVLIYKTKRRNGIAAMDILMFVLSFVMVFQLDTAGQSLVLCFFLGIVIRRSYQKYQITGEQRIVFPLMSAVIWAVAGMCTRDAYSLIMCITTAILIYAVLIAVNQPKTGSRCKCLKVLSGMTFPLYLLHYSVIELVRHCFAKSSGYATMWYCILLSLALSAAVYFLVNVFVSIIQYALIKKST